MSADLNNLIDNFCIKRVGNEACADALQLMRTGGFSAQDRGSIRFDRINLNVRILRFEILANSGNGTACAHPSHENINFSFRILPNFWTCCLEMRFRVDRVYKLSGNKAVGVFFSQLFSFGNSAFHAFLAVC